MATAIINGVEFNMTVSEMMEFCAMQTQVEKVRERVQRTATEKPQATRPAPKIQKPVENSSGEFEVEALCGHTVKRNSPRGRRPSLCADCKNGGNSDSEPENGSDEGNSEPKQERKRQGGQRRGGNRQFDQAKFDAWLEEHGDEEMLDKWERRIRWMISEGYKMSAIQRKKFLARLDREPRLTNSEAHNLRTEIQKGYKKV